MKREIEVSIRFSNQAYEAMEMVSFGYQGMRILQTSTTTWEWEVEGNEEYEEDLQDDVKFAFTEAGIPEDEYYFK